MGSDLLDDLHTWDYFEKFDNIPLVIFPRKGYLNYEDISEHPNIIDKHRIVVD